MHDDAIIAVDICAARRGTREESKPTRKPKRETPTKREHRECSRYTFITLAIWGFRHGFRIILPGHAAAASADADRTAHMMHVDLRSPASQFACCLRTHCKKIKLVTVQLYARAIAYTRFLNLPQGITQSHGRLSALWREPPRPREEGALDTSLDMRTGCFVRVLCGRTYLAVYIHRQCTIEFKSNCSATPLSRGLSRSMMH